MSCEEPLILTSILKMECILPSVLFSEFRELVRC